MVEVDIPAEWIDYNGHLTDWAYGIAFSRGVVAFLDAHALGSDYSSRTSCAMYTLEAHLRYLEEIHPGDRLRVSYRIVDFDSKRVHLLLTMSGKAGGLAATYESALLNVRQHPEEKPRSVELAPSVLRQIERTYKRQTDVLPPEFVGRAVSLKRRGKREAGDPFRSVDQQPNGAEEAR